MFSIAALLDRAKQNANLESDYRLAKVLRINQSALSNYRAGRSYPNHEICEAICALSGDDAGVIVAQIEAEKAAEGPVKMMWLGVAKRLSASMAGHAQPAILAAVFAIALIAAHAGPALAGVAHTFKTYDVNSLYIVSIGRIGRAGDFLLVRLRQFQGLFRLWMCCNL